jgi:hypothetical protein
MPHSSHLATTQLMEHVVRLRPERVLDVGVGYGKWGFLIREALDFMEGRHEPGEWRTRIDGIDAHPYESPLHAWVYDDIRVADALDVLDELAGYDVVVLGDVIEHFEKDDGLRLLRALSGRNRNVLVTTPLHFFEQELPGAPYETHRSHWTREDFAEWPHDYDVIGGSAIVVALAGAGATVPTRADTRASAFAYRLLPKRGAAARVVKEAVRRVV